MTNISMDVWWWICVCTMAVGVLDWTQAVDPAPPVEGDVRLRGLYSDQGMGLLEMYHGDEWKRVHNADWRHDQARVVCRQLHYADSVARPLALGHAELLHQLDADEPAYTGSYVTVGPCTGLEENVLACGAVQAYAEGDATPAGVSCEYELEAELQGDSSAFSGLLMLRVGSLVAPVKHNTFGIEEAKVACHMMGMTYDDVVPVGQPVDNPYVPATKKLVCTGEEDSLCQCFYKALYKSEDSADVVQLTCGMWATCSVEDVTAAANCGYETITVETCKQRACCWDQDSSKCYYPTDSPECDIGGYAIRDRCYSELQTASSEDDMKTYCWSNSGEVVQYSSKEEIELVIDHYLGSNPDQCIEDSPCVMWVGVEYDLTTQMWKWQHDEDGYYNHDPLFPLVGDVTSRYPVARVVRGTPATITLVFDATGSYLYQCELKAGCGTEDLTPYHDPPLSVTYNGGEVGLGTRVDVGTMVMTSCHRGGDASSDYVPLTAHQGTEKRQCLPGNTYSGRKPWCILESAQNEPCHSIAPQNRVRRGGSDITTEAECTDGTEADTVCWSGVTDSPYPACYYKPIDAVRPCPLGWTYKTGSCYKVVLAGAVGVVDADQQCWSEGHVDGWTSERGHLLHLNSYGELQSVFELLQSHPDNPFNAESSFLIGSTYSASKQAFVFLDHHECRTDADGTDYTGTQAVTSSGHDCLPWIHGSTGDLQFVSSVPAGLTDGQVVDIQNYCRITDGQTSLGCYVEYADVGWQECDVPMCEDEMYFMSPEMQGDGVAVKLKFPADPTIDNATTEHVLQGQASGGYICEMKSRSDICQYNHATLSEAVSVDLDLTNNPTATHDLVEDTVMRHYQYETTITNEEGQTTEKANRTLLLLDQAETDAILATDFLDYKIESRPSFSVEVTGSSLVIMEIITHCEDTEILIADLDDGEQISISVDNEGHTELNGQYFIDNGLDDFILTGMIVEKECVDQGTPCPHSSTVDVHDEYEVKLAVDECPEMTFDECASNPCMNGGDCQNQQYSFECNCVENYTGPVCEIAPNFCVLEDFACNNGGTCVSKEAGAVCECGVGYDGLHCEIDITYCTYQVDCNNGTCVEELDGYRCNCEHGYTGEHCDSIHPFCSAVSVVEFLDGGQHLGHNVRYTTHDGALYMSYTYPPPDPLMVEGGAGVNYTATLLAPEAIQAILGTEYMDFKITSTMRFATPAAGYEGDILLEVIVPGLDHTEIWLLESRTSFTLTMLTNAVNFNSVEPEVDDDCMSSPHLLVGLLIHSTDGVLAEATLPDYSVELKMAECPHTETNECDSNPCENGGVCEESYLGYRCACDGLFTGDHCEIVPPGCTSDPCDNGGTCGEASGGDYGEIVCECTADYSGSFCENAIDHCATNDCVEDQTNECVNIIGGFECRCEVGFEGRRCEEATNYCASLACSADHGDCQQNTTQAWCVCDEGYQGGDCTQEINYCTDVSPEPTCQDHAHCVSNHAGRTHSCVCDHGYEELTDGVCTQIQNMDWCNPSPCQNGGTCSERQEDPFYSCDCPPGYTDNHCQTDIDYCDNNECSDHSTCIEDLSLSENYRCECDDGYYGTRCNSQVEPPVITSEPLQLTTPQDVDDSTTLSPEEADECMSSPCHESATCVDYVGGYYCECTELRMGFLCEQEVTTESPPPPVVTDRSVSCPIKPTVDNSVILVEGYFAHSITKYQCTTGYWFSDYSKTKTIVCGMNGQWSDDPGSCEPVHCPLLGLPVGTLRSSTATQYGAVVTYWCHAGYESNTGASYWSNECMDDGQWQYVETFCNLVTCPNITLPSQPSLRGDRYQIVYCPSDQVFRTGLPTQEIECGSDGEWSMDDFSCYDSPCGAPPYVPHGQTYTHADNTRALVTCETGHRFPNGELSILMECINGGWDPFIEWECDPETCPPVPQIPHASSNKNTSLVGTSVIITCDRFYWFDIGVKTASIECNMDKTWSELDVACREILCPELLEVQGASHTELLRHVGDVIVYECDVEDYKFLHGGVTTVLGCQENGQWNQTLTDCQPYRCSPTTVPYTDLVIYNATEGSEVTYDCIRGYRDERYEVSATLTCNRDEVTAELDWHGVVLNCTEILCPAFSAEQHVQLSSLSRSIDDVITINCQQGYRLNQEELATSVSMLCLESGEWDIQLPDLICKPIICPVIPPQPHSEIRMYGITYDSLATQTCDLGYTVYVNGTSNQEARDQRVNMWSMGCNETEMWEPEINICQVVLCPEIRDWDDMTINTTANTYQTVLNYTCNDDLVLPGGTAVGVATCTHKGEWKPPIQPCQVPGLELTAEESPDSMIFAAVGACMISIPTFFIISVDVISILIKLKIIT